MLNLLSVSLSGADADGLARAHASAERQGFLHATHLAWNSGSLHGWVHPSRHDTEDFGVRTHDGIAACVGPLWYRGCFASAALSLLLAEVADDEQIDETALRGNFALFIATAGRCLLMNDAPGFVRIYVSADGLFYSTSWLAACAYAGQVDLNQDAAIEYVLIGASHSDETVAQGITTLPLAHTFDLKQKCLRRRLDSCDAWIEPHTFTSLDGAVEAICEHLRIISGEFASAFPGRVRAALSGGFDSRLIVAGLLAGGVQPELFVYGNAQSEDIPIARAVTDKLGLPLEVVDKASLGSDLPEPDVERLVRNALFFDGLPNDGIYDKGADEQTRLAQTAGGRLGLNGGGGEIFRNFFHLPNGRFSALDIVRTFYRGFDSTVFRHANGLDRYEERLAASIRRALGLDASALREALTRKQVELVYPLFRCHHWMGVNNSVGVRHGCYATPLVDLQTVRLASRLPLAWKNAGRLEACLISRLHPGIASHPSSYGFRFSDGPDWRARFTEWSNCARPVLARPFINATRRHLRKLGVSPGLVQRCRSLLPGEWRLDPILNLDHLPDNNAFARALAVEVVWRKIFT